MPTTEMTCGRLTITSYSEKQTTAVGVIIGQAAHAGDSIALFGELGSGKTCLTRGIAEGMGISKEYPIASPTFTLVNEYPGRMPLYHMDMYRLSESKDVTDLGYDDYFQAHGVVVVEWSDKIQDILPTDSLRVYLQHVNETTRKIHIEGDNEKMVVLTEKLRDGGFIEWH